MNAQNHEPPVKKAPQPIKPTSPAPTPVGQTFLSARDEVAVVPDLTKTRRRLPHWRLSGATCCLTFRVAAGELSPPERTTILQHIRAGHGKFYDLIAAVIMPDHVHLLLQPSENVNLSRITKGIKGVSAHRINQLRHTTGSIWQDESWDRIMRNQPELDEKLEYMLNNPMKRDLVDDPWQYEWWFFNPELPV